jgi:hypothetical protein
MCTYTVPSQLPSSVVCAARYFLSLSLFPLSLASSLYLSCVGREGGREGGRRTTTRKSARQNHVPSLVAPRAWSDKPLSPLPRPQLLLARTRPGAFALCSNRMYCDKSRTQDSISFSFFSFPLPVFTIDGCEASETRARK